MAGHDPELGVTIMKPLVQNLRAQGLIVAKLTGQIEPLFV